MYFSNGIQPTSYALAHISSHMSPVSPTKPYTPSEFSNPLSHILTLSHPHSLKQHPPSPIIRYPLRTTGKRRKR